MSNIFRKQGVNTGGGGGGSESNPNFIGTTAEWNALSSAEKASFDKSNGVTVNLSDDSESTVPIVTNLGGSVIHGNKILVPLEKNTMIANNITLQSIAYCGINSIMACTPIKVEPIDNAFIIEVSENIGTYIGYYAVITISHS